MKISLWFGLTAAMATASACAPMKTDIDQTQAFSPAPDCPSQNKDYCYNQYVIFFNAHADAFDWHIGYDDKVSSIVKDAWRDVNNMKNFETIVTATKSISDQKLGLYQHVCKLTDEEIEKFRYLEANSNKDESKEPTAQKIMEAGRQLQGAERANQALGHPGEPCQSILKLNAS